MFIQNFTSITSYPLPSSGNVSPTSTLSSGFDNPDSEAFDASGDLWMTNFNGDTLNEFTPSQLAAGGSQSPAVVISKSGFSLAGPDGLAFTPSGDLWVANFQGHTLVMFTPAQLAASGSPVPAAVIGASGSALDEPADLVFDGTGNLWVASYLDSQLDGYTPSQVASNGSPAPAVTISGAGLSGPQGVTFDDAGDAWVGNATPNTAVEFTPSMLAASGTPTPAVTISDDGGGTSIDVPYQIAFDSIGNLWVANFAGSISGFSPSQLGASGAPVPTNQLIGGGTGLIDPTGIALADPPPAPTNVNATVSGRTATITWRAPITPVYATDYQVTPVANGIVQPTVDTHSASTTFSTAVIPGVSASFRVTASNVFGTGPPGTSNPTGTGPAGYDLAGSDGGVFVFPVGQASGFFSSLPGLGVKVNNVVGIVPTNSDQGYDLVGNDGGVFVFPTGQSAGFFGSLPGLNVKVSNIVGIVPTNNDQGYDLVGNDGGVFVFPVGQSSGFFGSLPSMNVHVNDIVGIVATPGGGGYFLVGKDGGVFTFGNAPFLGSLPGIGVSVNNISGIASTPDGQGYYVVGTNGAVYAFGDAHSFGSLPGLGVTVTNIVSIVPTPDGGGYWLIGSDGGVFAFGDATSQGSLPGVGVHVSNIVGAVPTG